MKAAFEWRQRENVPHYVGSMACITCIRGQAQALSNYAAKAENFKAADIESSILTAGSWMGPDRLAQLVGREQMTRLAEVAEELVHRVEHRKV